MRRLSVLGAAAGALMVAFFLRRRTSGRDRVDVYYSDGSMMSLEAGGAEAERMLATAREGLAATRS